MPDEGIEPPTFGLQNRCTTAVLIRPAVRRWLAEGNGRRAGGRQGPPTIDARALERAKGIEPSYEAWEANNRSFRQFALNSRNVKKPCQ